MFVIIDRFDGDFAVVELEDKTIINVPKILFIGAKEGDIIKIEVDKKATDERKNKIINIMDNIWED